MCKKNEVQILFFRVVSVHRDSSGVFWRNLASPLSNLIFWSLMSLSPPFPRYSSSARAMSVFINIYLTRFDVELHSCSCNISRFAPLTFKREDSCSIFYYLCDKFFRGIFKSKPGDNSIWLLILEIEVLVERFLTIGFCRLNRATTPNHAKQRQCNVGSMGMVNIGIVISSKKCAFNT